MKAPCSNCGKRDACKVVTTLQGPKAVCSWCLVAGKVLYLRDSKDYLSLKG